MISIKETLGIFQVTDWENGETLIYQNIAMMKKYCKTANILKCCNDQKKYWRSNIFSLLSLISWCHDCELCTNEKERVPRMLLGFLKLATDCECPLSKIFLKIFLKNISWITQWCFSKIFVRVTFLGLQMSLSQITDNIVNVACQKYSRITFVKKWK